MKIYLLKATIVNLTAAFIVVVVYSLLASEKNGMKAIHYMDRFYYVIIGYLFFIVVSLYAFFVPLIIWIGIKIKNRSSATVSMAFLTVISLLYTATFNLLFYGNFNQVTLYLFLVSYPICVAATLFYKPLTPESASKAGG